MAGFRPAGSCRWQLQHPGRTAGRPPGQETAAKARRQARNTIGQLSQRRVEAARVAGRHRIGDGPVHRCGLAEFLVGQVADGDKEVAVVPDVADVPGPQPGQRQAVAWRRIGSDYCRPEDISV